MDRSRLAPLVGIVGCLLVVAVLAVPYLLVRTAPASSVGFYYAAGAINPLLSGLFAFVGLIVIAAGREGRTDPGLAAGIALALGVFMVGVTVLWATTVPIGVVFDMDAPAIMAHHRLATTVAAGIVPVAGVWWARTLGLL